MSSIHPNVVYIVVLKFSKVISREIMTIFEESLMPSGTTKVIDAKEILVFYMGYIIRWDLRVGALAMTVLAFVVFVD